MYNQFFALSIVNVVLKSIIYLFKIKNKSFSFFFLFEHNFNFICLLCFVLLLLIWLLVIRKSIKYFFYLSTKKNGKKYYKTEREINIFSLFFVRNHLQEMLKIRLISYIRPGVIIMNRLSSQYYQVTPKSFAKFFS